MPSIITEYSASNRTCCLFCEEKIKKGDIRVGYHLYSGGHWYHPKCWIQSDKALQFVWTGSKGYDFDEIWGRLSWWRKIRGGGGRYEKQQLTPTDRKELQTIIDQFHETKAKKK
eukprot:26594_1